MSKSHSDVSKNFTFKRV